MLYSFRGITWACVQIPPDPSFPFRCLVRTFPVIPPRLLAVTPPNFAYLANVLIRVMRLYLRPSKQRGFKSQQVPNFFGVGIRKYFFTDCTGMQSSNEAKLMELIKPIIRQNAVVKLSYPTGVGSNPARSQCFSRFISVLSLYR